MLDIPDLRYHRIDGELVHGAGRTVEDKDPSDRRNVVAEVTLMSPEQAEMVLHAAASSADWRHRPAVHRGQLLLRAALILRERAVDIARVVSIENGKTLAEAAVEVAKAADFLEYFGGLGRGRSGYLVNDSRPDTVTRIVAEPLGVVVLITPWNDPILTPARKLAPALLAGNNVVMKPASDTPLAARLLVDVLLEAGLPPQAAQLVHADHEVMSVVLEHESVRAVSFTGSTRVGVRLQQQLAGRPLRVQTEMGGKNAAIVLEDADLDLAATAIAAGAFGQAGQRCTATSRLLVHAAIVDGLVERLVAAAGEISVGASTDPGTMMGPLVSDSHRTSVGELVERSLSDVAVLAGADSPDGAPHEHGSYYLPTILAEVPLGHEAWTTEIFGPVLAVRSVDSLETAVVEANDSPYGLSAAVFTQSLGSAERLIADLDVGQVAVNLPTSGWDVHVPFGGFKLSGSAFKEQGADALNFYTRTKTASVRHG